MAKVVKNIEITEEEAQVLVKACTLIDFLTHELNMTAVDFFEQLSDICDKITIGQSLSGEVIIADYDNYEFKIVGK